jgi:hypothetical protein
MTAFGGFVLQERKFDLKKYANEYGDKLIACFGTCLYYVYKQVIGK